MKDIEKEEKEKDHRLNFIITIGIAVVFSAILLLVIYWQYAKILDIKGDAELNQLKIKNNYEREKGTLELKILKLTSKNILLNVERDSLGRNYIVQLQKTNKLETKIKKLRYDISRLKRPDINYADSTISTLDAFLPK